MQSSGLFVTVGRSEELMETHQGTWGSFLNAKQWLTQGWPLYGKIEINYPKCSGPFEVHGGSLKVTRGRKRQLREIPLRGTQGHC